MTEETKVTGTTPVGVAGTTEPAATTDPGVASATPSTTPSDAALNGGANDNVAQYEEMIQTLNKDLNNMKSTFQRNEARLKQEFQQREQQYRQELEQLKVATMDEDERKAYEATAAQRQLAELSQLTQQLAAEREEALQMTQAQNWFLSMGVPADELVLDEGYDELWNSGMNFITNELQTYRSGTKGKAPAATAPTVTAPAVVTTNNAPASVGPTWSELLKTYGDEETVYRLFETGQLPVDMIPKPGKI